MIDGCEDGYGGGGCDEVHVWRDLFVAGIIHVVLLGGVVGDE